MRPLASTLSVSLVWLAGLLFWSAPFLPQPAGAQAVLAHRRGAFRDGAPAPTYLVEEDFEGGSTAAGWTDSGSPNWNYTASPILGSVSWGADAGSDISTTPGWTDADEIYIFFAVRLGTPPSNARFIEFMSGSVRQASLEYRASGAVRMNHGTATSTGSVIGAGTYYFWVKYVKSTATNGEMRVWHSSDQTRGAETITAIAAGTSTEGIDQIRLVGNAVDLLIIDKLRADDEDIGSSPP